MGEVFYTVLEIQMQNGLPGNICTVYKEEEGQKSAESRAMSAYYSVLAAAALSEIDYHAAYLIRSDGAVMGEKIFDRRAE